jgi:microcystin degradation protein MlrC
MNSAATAGRAKAPAFIALFETETNTFSPIPTDLAAFEEAGLRRRDASVIDPGGSGAMLNAFRTLAELDGRAVIESISASAQPAGLVIRSVYETLRDQLLDDLRAAGPVGMVLLALHGAMIAEGYDDCEGDIIARAREIVGRDVPIGVELDPHCHLTAKMVDEASAIVMMHEYPHTDWNERAAKLYAICAAMASGTADPVSWVCDCSVVGFFPTTEEPMAGFVRLMKEVEGEHSILAVSLAHGFPWGDHPDVGARLLVIADGDITKARAAAERLRLAFYDLRRELQPQMPSIAEALIAAKDLEGRIILADTADNPGAGAPGDTTHLLQALLGADLGPIAFGALYDPDAVRICKAAGVGATVQLPLGGKLGESSGAPLYLKVEVKAYCSELHQTMFGVTASLGSAAWVQKGETDIVIVSKRAQIFSPDAFCNLGIDLEEKRVIAVKSSEHFRAAFSALSDHIISVATPGAIQMDFAAIPYRHKRDMNFYPRVADPLSLDGKIDSYGALRAFVAGLAHETNGFSPIPTSLRSFQEGVCYRPPLSENREAAIRFVGYGDAIRAVRNSGNEAIEGPFFWAQPSGPVSALLYRELREEILDRLREAQPLDMVILFLHGAMMAEGTDDPEGDLLSLVREIVGPNVPIGAVLDLHGNVSPRMIESGALLVGVKEYPHTDFAERVAELYEMLGEQARHGVQFTTTFRTIPRLSVQGTTEGPMHDLVCSLTDLEGRDGIRSVTLMHGFPWSDYEHVGASVLVVSENADDNYAALAADAIAERFFTVSEASASSHMDLADAVDAALATAAASVVGAGPVVIADGSDNPGGGAAGDSTFILSEILARDCNDVALGMIWDPQAARIASDAGVGARLQMRIGGKVGPLSGDPLDVEVQVLAIRSDVKQRFFSEEGNAPLGLTVALRIGSIDIVVNSIRQQVFSPECFTEFGIDLASKAIVVVKSGQHFRTNFDPIAAKVIYCNAPGSLDNAFDRLPYRKLRAERRGNAVETDRPVARFTWPRRF